MPGYTRILGIALFAAALICTSTVTAQTPPPAAQNNSTAILREVKADGLKTFTNDQVAALSGLQIGQQVGKDDLQGAADKLVQSGVFAHVKYNFQSRADGLAVTFHLEEAAIMFCGFLKSKGREDACEVVPGRDHMNLYQKYTTYPEGLSIRIDKEMRASFEKAQKH